MITDITNNITSIFFPVQSPGMIGTINIDVVEGENTNEDCEVTEFPVETGSYISDNIYVKPLIFSLKGFLSDAPVGYLQTYDNITAPTNQSLIESALDALETLKFQRTPFTVVTGLRIYNNVVFQSLNFSRDPDNGRSVNIDCTFKQIVMASYQTAQIPNNQVKGTPSNNTEYSSTTDNGSQQPVETPVQPINKGSILSSMFPNFSAPST